jgi:hypothetical protein
MAIYHLNAKWHTRKKNTKLRALRAYAYRAGARVFDPLNNRVYNSTNKKEVVHCETVGPTNAAAWMLDPLALWGHIEQRETRRDSVLFAEWEGALPNELGLDECKAIVTGFVTEFMLSEGQVVSWALHDKRGNRHFHAMCTTREIEGDGFGKKNNRWRQWAMLYKTREGLAKHINIALEKAGLPQRVTHKSYADLGIDREPTKHVGPEHSGVRDASYRAKREERLRNNRRVKVVNQQRGKRRSAAARKCLVAGAQGAKLTTLVRDHLMEARQLEATPVSPTMSADEVAAYNYIHTALPEADAIYLSLGRVRAGLGREWSWPTMAAQYMRLDKSGGDVLTALLVKELIWVVNRSPEQTPEFAKLVPRTRLADVAVAAKNWAQSASKPDALYLIDSILQAEGIGVSDGSGIQAVVLTGNPAAPDFSNYADALAPLAYLISDMSELVDVCQRVAHSIEKKISPDILAKRVNRILANVTWPTTQAELLDALVAGEVVFVAKRRQHRLADVLDAVPPDRRSHFEAMVTSVLGGCTVDAGHAVASRALSQQAQMEVQAECNLRIVLTEWQLADYPARCVAMAAIGRAYPWSEFQRDIQLYAQSESGWQSAWWQEKQATLQVCELAPFCERLPTWLNQTRSKQYPLGAHDPDPAMTLMRNLLTHGASTPDASRYGNGSKVSETATPLNPSLSLHSARESRFGSARQNTLSAPLPTGYR